MATMDNNNGGEEFFRDFAPNMEDDDTEEGLLVLDQEKIRNEKHDEAKSPQQNDATYYNPKKPKWWIQRGQRRGTKAQRKAMAAMKDYMLPRVSYGETIDWNQVFDYKEIWLEIGFGQGENLLSNAERHPDVGIVGAEIHKPGVGNVLKRMHESVQTNQYWSDYDTYTPDKDPFSNQSGLDQKACSSENNNKVTPLEKPYSNVRVQIGDGMKLLPYIASHSISCLFVTFPDPFPGKAEKEYRLVQVHTLQEMYRILCPQKGRFFLATDHEGYYDWCTSVFDQVNKNAETAISQGETTHGVARFRQVTPCPDRTTWLPAISKYEQKGWDEGRSTLFQCWEVWPVEKVCS